MTRPSTVSATCDRRAVNMSRVKPHMKQICRRVVSDILIIGAGGIVLLLFKLIGSPHKRGFYCDDETLMYPFHSSTVTSGMLYGIGFALGVVLIGVIEATWVYKVSGPKASHLKSAIARYGRFHTYLRNFYLSLVPFVFGAVAEHIITDIGKYTIGRLRPHFFDVCKVDFSKVNCSAGYIEEFTCQQDDSFLLKEMRLSFPSGHASFSSYVAVYLIIYLQRRMTFLFPSLIRPLLQLLVFFLAWYTCLSRVTDNKHHPTDVMGGALNGLVTASLVAVCVSDLFPRTNRIEKVENTHYGTMEEGSANTSSGQASPTIHKTTYF